MIRIRVLRRVDLTSDVLKHQRKNNIRFLYRASAYTKTIVSRTIQKGPSRKKNRARPGKPPVSQKNVLRKTIRFWVDTKSQSAKVGPMALAGKKAAPEALEFGGVLKSGWNRGKYLEPRPYLGPALDKAKPKFSAIKANSKK